MEATSILSYVRTEEHLVNWPKQSGCIQRQEELHYLMFFTRAIKIQRTVWSTSMHYEHLVFANLALGTLMLKVSKLLQIEIVISVAWVGHCTAEVFWQPSLWIPYYHIIIPKQINYVRCEVRICTDTLYYSNKLIIGETRSIGALLQVLSNHFSLAINTNSEAYFVHVVVVV
jgi:hypothetical protein